MPETNKLETNDLAPRPKIRVGVIRFSSLGDIVLTLNLISYLKQLVWIELYFITKEDFSPLVELECHHENVITLNKNQSGWAQLNSLVTKIKKIKLDLIIDLHGSLRSKLVSFLLFSIPIIKFDKRILERKFHVLFKKKVYINEDSIVQRYLTEIFQLYFHRELEDPAFFQLVGDSVKGSKQTYIAICPFASFNSKQWDFLSFLKLAELILTNSALSHYQLIWLGPKLANAQPQFSQMLDRYPDQMKDMLGKTSFQELAQYLGGAQLTITNDSGPLHLSEYLGGKVLAIFGPTHSSFGFAPKQTLSRMIDHDLPCRPCSTLGNKKCYLPQQLCFTQTTPQMVYDIFLEMMELSHMKLNR